MSYVLNSSKRTLATFVSRKTEMKLRIYPKYIQEYQSFLDTLPEKVKKEIKKASVCKRLINPDDCNPKCVMGYTFVLDGEQYQKLTTVHHLTNCQRGKRIKTFLIG